MTKSDRRSFLTTAPAAAAAAATLAGANALADEHEHEAEHEHDHDDAHHNPVKKTHWPGREVPKEAPLFSPVVTFGNMVFLSGIGAHFEGDVKAHTAHVLDEMKKNLEAVGSSVEKVLKVNVYLNDLKDYKAMNEVFRGRFGKEPGVRTTIAAAGGIPGDSLVEIDCIAFI
jgi:enamine deaminase RidA (YjgF/YER057c/UK114 family)